MASDRGDSSEDEEQVSTSLLEQHKKQLKKKLKVDKLKEKDLEETAKKDRLEMVN